MDLNKVTVNANLLAYLADEGVLEQFMDNLVVSFGTAVGEDPIVIDSIAQAFEWKETPEGHDFWEELTCQFEEGNELKDERVHQLVSLLAVGMTIHDPQVDTRITLEAMAKFFEAIATAVLAGDEEANAIAEAILEGNVEALTYVPERGGILCELKA